MHNLCMRESSQTDVQPMDSLASNGDRMGAHCKGSYPPQLLVNTVFVNTRTIKFNDWLVYMPSFISTVITFNIANLLYVYFSIHCFSFITTIVFQDKLRTLRLGLTGLDCNSDWIQLNGNSEILNIHYYEQI